MLTNKAKVLFFAKFQNLTMKLFPAALSPFCSYSVSLVSMQISEPCEESIKATNTFIYSLSLLRRFRSRTGVPKLSLAMYPFNISIDEHVPLKFLMKKRLKKITKINLSVSMILKIIFTDERINISKLHSLYANIFFPSIVNLKCTPSDREGSPKGTCIPVWESLV